MVRFFVMTYYVNYHTMIYGRQNNRDIAIIVAVYACSLGRRIHDVQVFIPKVKTQGSAEYNNKIITGYTTCSLT